MGQSIDIRKLQAGADAVKRGGQAGVGARTGGSEGETTHRGSQGGAMVGGTNVGAETNARASVEKGGVWAFLNKDIALFGNGLPDKVKEGFYHELKILLEAGVDIITALELIAKEQSKKKIQAVFERLIRDVENGSTLSAALQQFSYFTTYEYYSVRIGEETGRMSKVLGELGTFYQKKIKQRRQIIGAMTYPVIVLAVAFSAVSFMMAYVVPMFSDILKRFGGDLPWVTQMVMNASSLLRRSAPLLLGGLALVVFFVLAFRKKESFRDLFSRIVLRIPVVGNMVRKIFLSRMANAFSLLIGAKVPILQAIQLIRKMVQFYPVERTLEMVEQDILAGVPLYKSLGKHALYPAKMVSLVKVGEETNQLELFFDKIAEQYSNEVEYQTNLLSKLMEPLIIVVLGLVVGVILIAMYLPLFKMGQNI